MEAQREVRGESECVMKVTDKWNGGKEFKEDVIHEANRKADTVADGDTIQYNFIAKWQMHKKCVMVPSTHTHTPTSHTHIYKTTTTKNKQTNKQKTPSNYNGKNINVVQRVDLIRLKW